MKRWLIRLLGAFLLLAVGAGVAFAHASLVKSDPAPNAVLSAAPSQVQLWFDEPVDAQFSEVQVYDPNHNLAQAGALQLAPGDSKSLILPVALPGKGTFSVVWKVLSAADGHITRGVYAFSVGEVTGGATTTAAGPEELTPLAELARGLGLFALLALVGGFFFRLLLLDPSLEAVEARTARMDAGNVERTWLGLAGAALALLLAANFVELLLQANLITEQVSLQSVADVLFDTRYGALWIVRLFFFSIIGAILFARTRRVLLAIPALCLVVLIGFYLLANSAAIAAGFFLGKLFDTAGLSPADAVLLYAHHLGLFLPFVVFFALAFYQKFNRRGLLPVISALALLTYSLGSHAAAAEGDFSLGVLADWLHLFCVSIWVGGLFSFVLLMPVVWRRLAPEDRGHWLSRLIGRFSIAGLVTTPIIALTGIYSSVQQIPSLDSLRVTLYGNTLVVKVALFIVMLLFGALHLLLVGPRLRGKGESPDASRRLFSRFRITLTAEALFGLCAILLAAMLTLEPPARAQLQSPSAPPVAQSARVLFVGQPGPGVRINLVLSPDPDAPSHFDARVVDGEGQPVADILRVMFQVTLLDSDAGVQTVVATPASDGHYLADGNLLPLPGMWRIRVVVRRKGLEDVSSDFPYMIALKGAETPAHSSPALELLRQAEARMDRLTSLKSDQDLNDGANGLVVTHFNFHAPDRLEFSIEGQGSSIAIGPIQYYQDKDGSWSSQGRAIPYVFPNFNLAPQALWATFGRSENSAGGEPAQVVRFAIPSASSAPIEYAYWVSTSDQRILQLAMVAENHYMMEYYHDFDAPGIEIQAPAAVAPAATPRPTAASPSGAAPLTGSRRPPGLITGDLEADGGLLLLVGGIAAGVMALGRAPFGRWRLGALAVAAGLILAGLGLFVDASAATSGVNRSVDATLAEAGRSLYQENCVACHGIEGKGDGPEAGSLPVRPFDLTTHVLLHDDYYLLAVILNGRGYMPAFGDRLTQDEIVQVVAYIRQLALDARKANPGRGFTPSP